MHRRNLSSILHKGIFAQSRGGKIHRKVPEDLTNRVGPGAVNGLHLSTSIEVKASLRLPNPLPNQLTPNLISRFLFQEAPAKPTTGAQTNQLTRRHLHLINIHVNIININITIAIAIAIIGATVFSRLGNLHVHAAIATSKYG